MKRRKIITFLILILILSCAAKTDETPPSPDGFSEASWLKNGDFMQAVILEKQKENGKFQLEGYGRFNGYLSLLAQNIQFNEKKKILSFSKGWIFPDNLSDRGRIKDASLFKIYLNKGEFSFQTTDLCRYQYILIHKEKTNIITVYTCRVYEENKSVYKKIFEDKSFTVSTWGWYGRVFSSEYNDMGIEK
jgi:hypothetical protein